MEQPSSALLARRVLGQGEAQDGRLVLLFETDSGATEALVMPPALVPDIFQAMAVTAGNLADNDDGASFLIPTAAVSVARATEGDQVAIEFRTPSGARIRLAVDESQLAGLAEALTAAVAGGLPASGAVRH